MDSSETILSRLRIAAGFDPETTLERSPIAQEKPFPQKPMPIEHLVN